MGVLELISIFQNPNRKYIFTDDKKCQPLANIPSFFCVGTKIYKRKLSHASQRYD